MTYPQLALGAVGLALLLDLVWLRTCLLRRAGFWAAYGLLLAFQLTAGGSERAAPGADPGRWTSGPLAAVPTGDLLLGFALVLWTSAWWVGAVRPDRVAARPAGPPTPR